MAYAQANDNTKKKRPKVEDTLVQLIEWAHSPNVAEHIDEDRLAALGDRVVREYEIDETSRADWKKKAEKALERAKLKSEPKNYPFDNASNVKFPLLTVAALQFAARAYPAIVDGQKVVKGQVIGADPNGEKRSKADRVSSHMSYQLTYEMPEWEEDTDTLLHQIPIVGCAFRKVFRDPVTNRNRSEMVSALDFCVNQKTKSIETVPRGTHIYTLYPYEIDDLKDSGEFLDVDLGISSGEDEDEPVEFLEQIRYCDLNEDGQREPWIVTVHKETSQVVRIQANFDPNALRINEKTNKLQRIERYSSLVKYPFFRDPSGGFYDLGFGELLESISEVIDTTINQMMDAGHLQTAGGGFVGSGLGLKKQTLRFSPGKYHVVAATGGTIRESIYNMEHPGPSNVLFQLLGMMVEAGREIANIKDILTGDSNRSATATTTLALIEQGMKVYTSIYKRIYRALQKEYKLLYALNAKHMDEQEYFTVLDDEQAVSKTDYDAKSVDVMPVADPNVVTDMQRLARAQVYLESSGHPLVNGHEAMRRYFEAVGAEKIDDLLPPKQEGPNPMEELQARGAAAEVAEKDSKAKEQEAKAQETQAKAQKTSAEAQEAMAKAAVTSAEAQDYLKQRREAEAEQFGSEALAGLARLMNPELVE